MKLDIKKAIIVLGRFLGKDYEKTIKDEDIFDKIIVNSNLENMKKNQQRWSSKRPENMPPFIRKGQVGDWKNYFSPQQEKRLTEKFLIRTQGTGLKTLWEGIF
jgi:hypothetical protein